jgi:hypothetical protein
MRRRRWPHKSPFLVLLTKSHWRKLQFASSAPPQVSTPRGERAAHAPPPASAPTPPRECALFSPSSCALPLPRRACSAYLTAWLLQHPHPHVPLLCCRCRCCRRPTRYGWRWPRRYGALVSILAIFCKDIFGMRTAINFFASYCCKHPIYLLFLMKIIIVNMLLFCYNDIFCHEICWNQLINLVANRYLTRIF